MPHIIQKDDSTNARSRLTHSRIPGRILRPRPPTEGRAGDARATRFAPETARSALPAVKTAPHSALHCQVSAFQRFSLSYQWSVHSPGGTASHGNMTFCWTDPFIDAPTVWLRTRFGSSAHNEVIAYCGTGPAPGRSLRTSPRAHRGEQHSVET